MHIPMFVCTIWASKNFGNKEESPKLLQSFKKLPNCVTRNKTHRRRL